MYSLDEKRPQDDIKYVLEETATGDKGKFRSWAMYHKNHYDSLINFQGCKKGSLKQGRKLKFRSTRHQSE